MQIMGVNPVLWVVEVRYGKTWSRKEYKYRKSAIKYAINESNKGKFVTVWEYDADNKLVSRSEV